MTPSPIAWENVVLEPRLVASITSSTSMVTDLLDVDRALVAGGPDSVDQLLAVKFPLGGRRA